jgi:selenide,water dikinase
VANPNVLVGFDTSDDAGVVRVRDDLAIVTTADFFTPIVDDPFEFGRIAATNALSDIYAMGASPVSALNLVAFSLDSLGGEVLVEILRGAAAVADDAGIPIVGGHSIDDAEPKYGLAVVGTVHPDRVLTNAGAQPGDDLVLTKPIGLGVISTAVKRDAATPELVAEAVRIMTTLNAGARDAALELGDAVHAATDVTGFGLVGHARELFAASGVAGELDAAAVPVIAGVPELVADGMVAGGTQRNHVFVSDTTEWGALPEGVQLLLADAQTSGGLLIAVAADRTGDLVDALARRDTLAAAVVGRCVAGPAGHITAR